MTTATTPCVACDDPLEKGMRTHAVAHRDWRCRKAAQEGRKIEPRWLYEAQKAAQNGSPSQPAPERCKCPNPVDDGDGDGRCLYCGRGVVR